MRPGFTNLLRFPFAENRPRVLGTTSFISLLFHGLLLGALGLALPNKSVSPPEDTGISIDLAALEASAPQQPSAPPDTPAIPETTLRPQKAKDPEPALARKNVEAPKTKAVPKKPVAKKVEAPKKSAMPESRGIIRGAPAGNTPATTSRVASNALVGQTIPPAPEGGSSTPRPPYPDLARKRGQEGTVNVRCQIDVNGQVTNISIVKSSGFRLLDEVALKTVGKWKFRPGKKDGANVAGTVIVPIQFKLQ